MSNLVLTLEQFDKASDHPYECRCDLCKKWWEMVGPEDDGEPSEPYCVCDLEYTESEAGSNRCAHCGKNIQ